MKTFTLTIKLGNDAMQTPDDIAGALREVADTVQSGRGNGKIFDLNGNSVGQFDITGE